MKSKKFNQKNLIITLKIPYKVDNENLSIITSYVKNYNNVLRFTFNRVKENENKLKTAELSKLQNKMNNIFIDTHFLNSAQQDAKAAYQAWLEVNSTNPVIFGTRKLFIDRCQNKISKQEYQLAKLRPLYSIGEANRKSNRKFQIIDNTHILFKPESKTHIILELQGANKNYKKLLDKLFILQNKCLIPITYKLDLSYIYISFDLKLLQNNTELSQDRKVIKDRIFAIDMNPNYIGYSIVDWKCRNEYKIVSSGSVSIKPLNDFIYNKHLASDSPLKKKLNNKREYEIIKISHKLVELAKHFQCELFSMEELNIKSSDKGKGKAFNRACNNNWCRNLFVNQIRKMTTLYNIKLFEVLPNYSSFMGNLAYRNEKLPDYVLSSIEIGRRAFEFYHQYEIKDIQKTKNIILNDSKVIAKKISQSLEELEIDSQFGSLIDLYKVLKKSKVKYRFPLEQVPREKVFSKNYNKSFTILNTFL